MEHFSYRGGCNIQGWIFKIMVGWAIVHVWCIAGLAIQHWSGNLEGYAYHSQYEHAITRGIQGHAPKKISKISCSEIESESISNILLDLYIGVVLTLAVHILAIAICSFVIISTSVAIMLHLWTRPISQLIVTTKVVTVQWESLANLVNRP